MVEVWGHSKTLGRLSEAAYVAVEAGHPKACILADVYHMYKGGSTPAGLKLLGPGAVPVIHMNDYPAHPPRDQIKDEHRVYPGDGIAPLKEILGVLRRPGSRVALSLELFNRDYWTRDPMVVVRNGLEKMRAAVKGLA
jgi:sugar phosphate isomerase/epimerase